VASLAAAIPFVRSDNANGASLIPSAVVPVGFLQPRYLPLGWSYRTTYRDRPDGFLGQDEIALWFTRADSEKFAPRPLSIYQTREPKKAFGATEMHTPDRFVITYPSGAMVQADLHRGMWHQTSIGGRTELVWNPDDVLALTFPVGGLTVGIRASRIAGVDTAELGRIAAGLA
jgi:hypothetical protein